MISVFAAAALAIQTPEIPRLPEIKREPQVTYVDRNGLVLGVRGGRYAPPVDLTRVPSYVPAAFVAIEDRRFYEHSGFDAVGIARAIVSDLGRGRAAQGASTITQQLARNLFLTNEKTLDRKAKELVYAVELEQTYTKTQILGLYLSRVYFGSGAYGLEAASARYFNKPAARLSVREVAALAALMKSPTNYNPAEQPEASAARTRLVLDAMVETGAISSAQRARALTEPLKVYKIAPAASAQYFVDWVDATTHRMAPKILQDLVVETTLDLTVENDAAEAARSVVGRFRSANIEQAAVVSVDGSGRVRAMLGGLDYSQSQFNRVTDAHRQAGSTWKPFVYLTALEAGRTPDMMVTDEPVTIGNWSPSNYENSFAGPVTLETALAESINTVAARLADEVGRPKVAETARRLGIGSVVNTDPAMALGTTLVTPLEMAQAYSVLADGGLRNGVYGIERIRTGKGQVLYQRRVEPAPQVVNNPALSDLNQMLHAVVSRGTGTRAAITGRDVAGKTGTTSDYRDAWFCGFTGGLTTVVWMGRDDNTPMRRITGGIAPAELWRIYMVSAMKRLPTGPIPKGALPVAPVQAPPTQVEPQTPAAEPAPQTGSTSTPLDLEKLQNPAPQRF